MNYFLSNCKDMLKVMSELMKNELSNIKNISNEYFKNERLLYKLKNFEKIAKSL